MSDNHGRPQDFFWVGKLGDEAPVGSVDKAPGSRRQVMKIMHK